MARYTPVYSDYVSRLDEVEVLRRLALDKEKRDPISDRGQINALCRGSIVLLCSHLEAFVRELGQLALDSFFEKKVDRANISNRLFYHISKERLDEIERTTDPTRKSDKVFDFLTEELPFWSRSGPFPKNIDSAKFSRGFANPGFTKIVKYFGRFGYNDYRNDVTNALASQSTVTINMVNHLVDTRNKIAHGDLAATKTPRDIADMTRLIKKFTAATDGVFASWCRKNHCSIR